MSSSQSGDAWGFGTVDVDTPVARTHPLAIVSLVLGVVWCAGIGSLFAVIFGVQARRSIRQSGGKETGDRLAIAGLVLGIAGIVGTVLTTLLVVFVGITANNAAHDAIQQFSHRRVEVRVGRPVTPAASDFAVASGIKTVTVFAV